MLSWLELKLPPAVVWGLCALLMYLTAQSVPKLAIERAPLPLQLVLAAVLALVGIGIMGAGVFALYQARTTPNPLAPHTTRWLVTTGVYRYSRNPIYLGMLCCLLAWAVWLAHLLALVYVWLFAVYLTRFQIKPEERALRQKFGEAYEAYARSVRRWI